MPTNVKIFIILILISPIYGCFPLPYNYHQPSASGGKLIHSGHQLYSPKDAIEFRFEDIIIEIYGQNNWISIGIYVPEHNIVQLSSDFIWIYENNSKDMQKFQFDHAVYNDCGQDVSVNATDPLIGRTKRCYKFGLMGDRFFGLSANLNEKDRPVFYLKLPGIKVNSRLYEFPVIEFNEKSGMQVGTING